MGLRFRRSVKLAPGLRLNFSGSGMSLSAGVRGASVTFGQKGTYLNAGIPGTGIYSRERIGGSSRSQSRTRSISASSSPPQKTTVSVKVQLNDDGTVSLFDANGNRLPDKLLKVAKEQQGEAINKLLQDKVDSVNNELKSILEIHLDTPGPSENLTFTPAKFEKQKPILPLPLKIPFWGKIFKSIRLKAEDKYAKQMKLYDDELSKWEAEKAEHEKIQNKRKELIENGRFNNIESMKEFLGDVLPTLEWPRETTVDFEIVENTMAVFLDVDIPEIEDMPSQTAAIASRGIKINFKEKTQAQKRNEYAVHIHGIGFRLIGETFVALPKIKSVCISAYSQRLRKSTGKIMDDYLYSVKVNRDQWQDLNFDNLENIDVVECLGEFEIRRDMASTGDFKAIEPFQMDLAN